MRAASLVLVLLLCLAHGKVPSSTQLEAVRGLIARVVPERQSLFALEWLHAPDAAHDVWEVETVGSNVVLRGNSGVSLASAFNWYLKYKCNSVYLWQEEQINIPTPAPVVSPKQRVTSTVQYRYYYNVCTFGYSSAFWHWDRWEREIDWMAMNGINLPLSFVGQEYLWERIFAKLGMNMTEVRQSWFSNQAFLPWNRMGNINAWAGPLSEDLIQAQVLLQKQLLERQRSFGMQPILPGFAGHVPPPFVQKFPHANVSTLIWDPEFGNTYFLDPMDPLFQQLGTLFIQEQTALFGTDHFYNADPFNEMNPNSNDTTYLTKVSQGIFKSMTEADPNAIWILQGWFLLDGWWQPPQTQAFLDAVPDDSLIILDLWAEVDPYWKGHKNFYGKQFIWCMLHDFGGRSGLYAAFDQVNLGMADAFYNASANLVGIGLTPEAIETNPIIYDFMMEFAWNKAPRQIDTWVEGWSNRRYGVADVNAQQYWALLREILNCKTDQMAATASPLVMQPNLWIEPTVGCCANTAIYYDPRSTDKAWTTLLASAPTLANGPSRDTYLNDVVEITRQVLGDYAFIAYNDLITAWNNSAGFQKKALKFLQIFSDMDSILATRSPYLLGVWVERAQLWGVNQNDVESLRRGALLQVTSWGPPGPQNELWSGLLQPYYGKRWALFIDYLSSTNKTTYNRNTFLQSMFAWESSWVNDTTTVYPAVPQGDTVQVSQSLRAKYSNIDWSRLGSGSNNNNKKVNGQKRVSPVERKRNAARRRSAAPLLSPSNNK